MLRLINIKKTYAEKTDSAVNALKGINLEFRDCEFVSILGQSGCGKTTLGRTILKLHQPTGGEIIFNGEDITKYSKKEMRHLRTDMQIIFQDPYSSLPPRATVGDILSEPVVAEGQKVYKGSKLATISTSSTKEMSDGAHVHFAVTLNGQIANPYDYFIEGDK